MTATAKYDDETGGFGAAVSWVYVGDHRRRMRPAARAAVLIPSGGSNVGGSGGAGGLTAQRCQAAPEGRHRPRSRLPAPGRAQSAAVFLLLWGSGSTMEPRVNVRKFDASPDGRGPAASTYASHGGCAPNGQLGYGRERRRANLVGEWRQRLQGGRKSWQLSSQDAHRHRREQHERRQKSF
jgi:hypothetical protein